MELGIVRLWGANPHPCGGLTVWVFEVTFPFVVPKAAAHGGIPPERIANLN